MQGEGERPPQHLGPGKLSALRPCPPSPESLTPVQNLPREDRKGTQDTRKTLIHSSLEILLKTLRNHRVPRVYKPTGCVEQCDALPVCHGKGPSH